jgi:hypothetical protein
MGPILHNLVTAAPNFGAIGFRSPDRQQAATRPCGSAGADPTGDTTMTRMIRPTGLPARLFALARDTFEASVAIHYAAPWQRAAALRAHRGDRAA